jgi:hypothetical protein
MPIGAVLGSLFSNPSSLGFVFVLIVGLVAISVEALGVHYQTIGYLERGEYSPACTWR